MRRRLLDMLVCPLCGGALGLKAFRKESNEVMDGLLECRGCRKSFPVIGGIPRMLPSSMINAQLLQGFAKTYGSKVPSDVKEAGAPTGEKLKERTSRSFGFQWNVFSQMFGEYEKNFLNYIKPLEPGFFRGKLVLDAGCGFGRHTYYAAKYGAEVVGFDLSDAVEAAYKNCRKLNVHIVQGDIYHLPFRKRFDFIMSIGVLHHLPEPENGFLSLAGLMGSRTQIFVWLYGREGRWFKLHIVEGLIRAVTKHMPHRMLYYCCYAPAAVYHAFNVLYNAGGGADGSRLTRRLPFRGYAKFPFRVKHADAFDLLATPVNNYYTKAQVGQWAADAKLKDISITSMEGKSWRLFGRK